MYAIYRNVKWSFLLNTTHKPLVTDQLNTASYIKGDFRFKKKQRKKKRRRNFRYKVQ